MWKKIGVVLISLIATFSVVYAMNRDMSAASTYALGGVVNGKVHTPPTGITGSNIGLKKGDHVFLGDRGWVLTKEYSKNLWFSAAMTSEATTKAYDVWDATKTLFKYSNMKPIMDNLNTRYAAFLPESTMLTDRIINSSWGSGDQAQDSTMRRLFIPTYRELSGLGLTKEVAYSGRFWGETLASTSRATYTSYGDVSIGSSQYLETPVSTAIDVRPFGYWNLANVVFAVSKGSGSGLQQVSEYALPGTYTSLYHEANKYAYMKLRVEDASLTDSTTFNQIESSSGSAVTQSAVNSTVFLSVNALNGSSSEGVNTVSAIIFDSTNKFKYYLPLGDAAGSGTYPLDLTGIPVGNYQIGIVNEVYNESSDRPAYSSKITDVKSLEIVEPHTISYTATPQGALTTYEYTKNVKAREKVGTLSRSNGVVPITYRLVGDGDDTYQNFEIDGLDASGSSNAASLDVKIKATGAPDLISATNSLKAGTYKFCIESVDANGNPTTQEVGKSKLCVTLKVEKTSPTITFSTSTNKYMKIGASLFTDTITTTNKDTLATADVTYAITNGISGVLTPATSTSDPLSYEISIVGTHTGTGLPSTYDLDVTIEETDNYLKATTTTSRNIIAYKEMSALTWSASKTGGYSSTDVTSGSIIGTLLASDGVGPFKYEIVKAGEANFDPVKGRDFASFTVSNTAVDSGTKVDVKTASNLAIGTYNMQFRVTDASGDIYYTEASIRVDARAQAAVDFKDAPGGTVITSTGLTIKYDATTAKLFAEGGSTSNPIVYGLADTQPSGITNAADYADIDPSSGLITPKKVGTIKVKAKRPGDISYGDAVVYMDLTIDPAPQQIDFNDTTSPIGIEQGKSALVDAKGKVISTGTTGVGDITYSSDNTAIATVDASGNVTGVANGTITLTATLNDPAGSNYDPNYETVTATKTVNIYTGMSVTWAEKTPHLLAEANKAGDDLGTISVKDNQGAVTYAISTASNPDNADASYFQVIGSGTSAILKIKTPIDAATQSSHGGVFKVQVDVKDTKGSRTINIVIQIDEATNTIYFTDGTNKITTLSKVFGENSNTFNLTSYSKNSGSATYSDDGTGVLSVLGTGVTTINKVGTATVNVVIGSGSGYAGGTASMVVTITQGNQAIAFKDTVTTNREFTAGTTFSELAELTETSANTVSTRTITYTSNTPSVCTIDAAGTVTMVAKGTCDIDAKNTDSNWKSVTTNKKINLYTGMGVSFTQNPNLQAGTVNTAANAPAGSLTVSGGSGTKNFAISSNTGADNIDAALFNVSSSGMVSFKKAIKAADLVGKYDPVKKVYVLHVQVDTTDSLSNTVTTNAVVELKGEKLNASFETGGVGKIVEEYGLGKTFLVTLSSNAGGGVPTYQLKTSDPSMPTDVLQSVDPSGLVTILHANDPSANPNPVMVEAVIPASNGYDEETIEVEVEIVKASQPNFAFKNSIMKLGHEAQIKPIFLGQLTAGPIVLTSGNNALASIVGGTDVKANSTDGSVTITAIAPGDRDYKSATATATVNVSSAPAYSLILSVPSATYGDTGLSATIVLNGATGAILTQSWSSDDPSIADIDASGNITIHKAGTITISYTQTSVGEPSVTSTVTMVIAPKPITVTINNESKYVGEAMPSFTANIPTSDLVGADTIGQPTFSCKDGTGLVKPETKAGKYDITGAYPTGSYPDYNITVKKGTLTVKQDASLASWFHLEGDTSKTTLDPTKWHNQDVNVVLDPAVESAGTYNEISLDSILWDKTAIKVTTEGENNKSVSFRVDATDPTHPLAMSTPQPTTIKIDKTKPVIKSVTGTATNKDAISSLLNKLTFGAYFKPGTKVSIQSEDILPSPGIKVSGVKTVAYEIFEVDRKTGLIGTTAVAHGDLTPNASGISEVTMNDVGVYRVCAIATDNAGNQGTVSCSDLNVKNIGIDIDKDGTPDNLDPDDDGCPDIDIVLKDEEDKFYKLNVDLNGDGIPDLNIDANGDGKADINIDLDDDKVADLNIVKLTSWKPTVCVTGQSEEYCTDGSPIPNINVDLDGDQRPDINVDLNNDGIPDIDIDTDGDGVADINIDKDRDGTADEKLKKMKEWIIDSEVFEVDGVKFQTMKGLTEDTIDHLEDSGVIAKPGTGGIFLPNFALKVTDKTDSVDSALKDAIKNKMPDKTIGKILDVELTKDNVSIQPDGKISISVPVDSNIKNPKFMVENADGNYVEVEGKIENGYFVYDTDFVGRIIILGDEEEQVVDPAPTPTPTPEKKPEPTKPSVKGTYTSSIGGALTGDRTNVIMLCTVLVCALTCLGFCFKKVKK